MIAQGTILSRRYFLEEELGAGGMGTVYAAVDLRTGARVAVKVPHAFLIRDPQYVERLRREAQIAASMRSTRVALVTDFAEHEGIPYLVMEYVPGQTLADRIAEQGALPPEEALRVTLEIARALDAAHAAGIIHRDLKPHNIRLTSEGDVKVLDFGIARMEGQVALTAVSVFMGSPDYAAPERMEGPGDIRSDIYSLGVTLYEMLTGRLPFGSGTAWTILNRHLHEPPPPLPEGFPPMVYPIVDRCLVKRPEDRYQTPRELAQDLTAALRQLDRDQDMAGRSATHPTPLPAPPQPAGAAIGTDAGNRTDVAAAPPHRTGPTRESTDSAAAGRDAGAPAPTRLPRMGRGPALVAAAAAVAAVAVIALAALLLVRRGGSAEPAGSAPADDAGPLTFIQPGEGARVRGPVTVRVRADGLNLTPPAAGDPEGRHLHYFVDLDPALVVGPGQPVPTGQANIIHTAETEQPLDLPPGMHTVTVVVTGNDHRPLDPPLQKKVTFSVLPDLGGARSGAAAPIAYQSLVDGKWSLFTVNGDGRGLRRLSAGAGNDLSPAWSPDGKQIAFESNRDGALRIYVMNADGSDVRRITAGPGSDRKPSWSPDGKLIVFQSDRDGQDLLYVVAVAGGEVRQLTHGPGNDAHPVWSPDGALIAFHSQRSGNSRLYTVPVVGGEPAEVATGAGNDINPAWSPDGTRLAFASFRGGRWDIYVVPAEGGEPRRVTDSAANVQNDAPSWSPDGQQIVFQSDREGQQHIFVISAEGGPARRLTEGSSLNLAPVWPLR